MKKRVPFPNRGRLIARLARVLVFYDEEDVTRMTTREQVERTWTDASPNDREMRQLTARAMVRLLEEWEA